MRANVYMSELRDAHEWVSAAGPFENSAHVSRQSGQIFWATRTGDLEEELPEDVEDGTLYVCVPHKHDPLAISSSSLSRTQFPAHRC